MAACAEAACQRGTRAFGVPASVLGNPHAASGAEACAQPVRRRVGRRGLMAERPHELRVRGTADVRPRRAVRPRQRAVAAAADADVRPHLQHHRHRRRARQGPDRGRAQGCRQSGAGLVLRLPLQGRSGDAGLPGPRRAVAADRLLPRLARRTRQGPRARRGRGQVHRHGHADDQDACSTWST